MKGSISEFELGVIRARMLDAARAKARRGELRIGVPVGYVWHREIGLGLDPDIRLQQAIRRVFERFRQLGRSGRATIARASAMRDLGRRATIRPNPAGWSAVVSMRMSPAR